MSGPESAAREKTLFPLESTATTSLSVMVTRRLPLSPLQRKGLAAIAEEAAKKRTRRYRSDGLHRRRVIRDASKLRPRRFDLRRMPIGVRGEEQDHLVAVEDHRQGVV